MELRKSLAHEQTPVNILGTRWVCEKRHNRQPGKNRQDDSEADLLPNMPDIAGCKHYKKERHTRKEGIGLQCLKKIRKVVRNRKIMAGNEHFLRHEKTQNSQARKGEENRFSK